MPENLSFTLNGQPVSVETDESRRLLWVLRTDLESTGTKFGCGRGLCGTCTVLLNGRPVRSCTLPVSAVQGREVTTIEGLARGGQLHPLQQAFVENDALQCAFCTPGMILTAYGLLQTTPEPSREDIVRGMDRNLCRCGAHPRIVDAIQSAAAKMR